MFGCICHFICLQSSRLGTQRLTMIKTRVVSAWRLQSQKRIQNARPMLRFRYSTAAPAKSSYSYASAIAAFAATGGLTAAYFFWPSESRAAPTYRHESISPSHFTPVTLTASEDCGPNLKLLTLTIAPESLPSSSQSSAFWPIWSIFIKDDDIQVERPYTPLEGMDDRGNMKLWVKKYLKGEVGRWLHSKQVGDTVEIRGPLPTFHAYADTWDEIVMVRQQLTFLGQVSHHTARSQEGQAFRPSTSCSIISCSKGVPIISLLVSRYSTARRTLPNFHRPYSCNLS